MDAMLAIQSFRFMEGMKEMSQLELYPAVETPELRRGNLGARQGIDTFDWL